jgi:hypothetical protein
MDTSAEFVAGEFRECQLNYEFGDAFRRFGDGKRGEGRLTQ